MIQRDDTGWEGGSCLGTHAHPWWIHVNVWQNQYKFKNKRKKKEKKENEDNNIDPNGLGFL